jgi:hypothetical protein
LRMRFYVNYLRGGRPVGHPDRTKTILEARFLAPEGQLLYGADTAVIVSVDDAGVEKVIEKIKV